jgi:hypothetical protein
MTLVPPQNSIGVNEDGPNKSTSRIRQCVAIVFWSVGLCIMFELIRGDEDITHLDTIHGDEDNQHRRPSHPIHGGGTVQLKLESISDSRRRPG